MNSCFIIQYEFLVYRDGGSDKMGDIDSRLHKCVKSSNHVTSFIDTCDSRSDALQSTSSWNPNIFVPTVVKTHNMERHQETCQNQPTMVSSDIADYSFISMRDIQVWFYYSEFACVLFCCILHNNTLRQVFSFTLELFVVTWAWLSLVPHCRPSKKKKTYLFFLSHPG